MFHLQGCDKAAKAYYVEYVKRGRCVAGRRFIHSTCMAPEEGPEHNRDDLQYRKSCLMEELPLASRLPNSDNELSDSNGAIKNNQYALATAKGWRV